jgi:hypothetical protein
MYFDFELRMTAARGAGAEMHAGLRGDPGHKIIRLHVAALCASCGLPSARSAVLFGDPSSLRDHNARACVCAADAAAHKAGDDGQGAPNSKSTERTCSVDRLFDSCNISAGHRGVRSEFAWVHYVCRMKTRESSILASKLERRGLRSSALRGGIGHRISCATEHDDRRCVNDEA